MNKQAKLGKGRGIEWTQYSWNPVGGCFHACSWEMPDGSIANCYAEDVATRVAQTAYPQGFEHHYWHPAKLPEPLRVKEPSRIFVGSMADLFGRWVPEEQISQVLEVCRQSHWHTFQLLTKNPKRATQFHLPPNCWLGASTPPSFMWNKPLTPVQQTRMLDITLIALRDSNARTRWLSAEPLAFDIVPILRQHPGAVQWIVIGAASNGKTLYPPQEAHVRRLVDFCDDNGIATFFKGNLRSLPWAAANWREAYPVANV